MTIQSHTDWAEVERRACEFEGCKPEKVTLCHHCGKQIVWNVTYPDKKHSHWSHVKGDLHNGLWFQRQSCDRANTKWATPKRVKA